MIFPTPATFWEASVGTYREFVVFDASQIYPEYVILYEREFWTPGAKKIISLWLHVWKVFQGVFRRNSLRRIWPWKQKIELPARESEAACFLRAGDTAQNGWFEDFGSMMFFFGFLGELLDRCHRCCCMTQQHNETLNLFFVPWKPGSELVTTWIWEGFWMCFLHLKKATGIGPPKPTLLNRLNM